MNEQELQDLKILSWMKSNGFATAECQALLSCLDQARQTADKLTYDILASGEAK